MVVRPGLCIHGHRSPDIRWPDGHLPKWLNTRVQSITSKQPSAKRAARRSQTLFAGKPPCVGSGNYAAQHGDKKIAGRIYNDFLR
jgi:hypothetical protein